MFTTKSKQATLTCLLGYKYQEQCSSTYI